MTIEELRALAREVGFPDPDTAAAVAMAESGGDASAVHIVTAPLPGNLPERSFGLWQINTLAHPGFDEKRLLDPHYNANAALVISSDTRGWSQWSTFTTKDPAQSYRRFMPAGA
jgi:hypothetical protein